MAGCISSFPTSAQPSARPCGWIISKEMTYTAPRACRGVEGSLQDKVSSQQQESAWAWSSRESTNTANPMIPLHGLQLYVCTPGNQGQRTRNKEQGSLDAHVAGFFRSFCRRNRRANLFQGASPRGMTDPWPTCLIDMVPRAVDA
ncbi:hypothetical protein G7046_g1070 [Stylonectria norvegica]|nr:hypothetical protein G7046_g1070 [Stylonectria norvegica]